MAASAAPGAPCPACIQPKGRGQPWTGTKRRFISRICWRSPRPLASRGHSVLRFLVQGPRIAALS
jgi:hypothetical protein